MHEQCNRLDVMSADVAMHAEEYRLSGDNAVHIMLMHG